MRKTLFLTVIIIFLLSTLNFARYDSLKDINKTSKGNVERVEGRVVYINHSKNELVMKDNNKGIIRTFTLEGVVTSYLENVTEITVLFDHKNNKIEHITFDKARKSNKNRSVNIPEDQTVSGIKQNAPISLRSGGTGNNAVNKSDEANNR